MNIIKREFNLDQQGFDFGDSFDQVFSFTQNVIDFISEEKKYISTREIVFDGYIFTSTLFFRNGRLYSVMLYPVLRRYLSKEEFLKHDINACIRFSEKVIDSLKEKYSLERQNDYEYIFIDHYDKKIRLFYARDHDGFDIEVTRTFNKRFKPNT